MVPEVNSQCGGLAVCAVASLRVSVIGGQTVRFGELHFINPIRRSFSVLALTVCQCWYKTRTITCGLRLMELLEKGSYKRIFRIAWWNSFGSMCLGHEGAVRQINSLGSRKELDEFMMSHYIVDLLHKHPSSNVEQLNCLVLISWMRSGTCHC